MVSIVLPVYNGEKYLAQSIQSILDQTYTNWELIIVNDCSTDDSLKIAEGYAEQDARIHIISNAENKRVAKSLNIGFKQAKGKYFTWTSDDNLYDRFALEKMTGYLERCPESSFVYADMEYINQDGRIIANSSNECKNIYLRCCVGACFLYRREVRDTVGEYNPNVLYVDDYEYWLRVSFRYKLHHISEVLYKYRVHDGGMTHSREREIRRITAALKMKYADEISKQLGKGDLKVFCTTCLLYDAEVREEVERMTAARGIVYNVEERLLSLKADDSKKYIIFGAGMIGKEILQRLGKEKVAYFADNIINGTEVEGISVISFQKLLEIYKDYNVLIGAGYLNSAQIIEQFLERGLKEYMVYQSIKDEWG